MALRPMAASGGERCFRLAPRDCTDTINVHREPVKGSEVRFLGQNETRFGGVDSSRGVDASAGSQGSACCTR